MGGNEAIIEVDHSQNTQPAIYWNLYLGTTTLSRTYLILNSIRYFLLTTFSLYVISANGTVCMGTEARIVTGILNSSSPSLVHNQFSQFHLLDMPSSLSGNILVQVLIISLLGSAVNSIFVSLQLILYIFVTSLKHGFEPLTSLHKILDISHCPLSKLLSQAPNYLSSSFFHHLSLFPSYTEWFLVLCSAHLYFPLWNVHYCC